MDIISILNLVLICLVVIIFALAGIYLYVHFKNSKTKEVKKDGQNVETPKGETFNGLAKESIYKFMDFDEIKDNMIIRKKGDQFVMVIQCKGINYDLLSEEEKLGVENGFVQFLNTLSFPIQLYVQTRSVNLRDTVEEYKERVDAIRKEIEDLRTKGKEQRVNGNIKQAEKYEFDARRKVNVLEYGLDITDYIGRINYNKNVLQQKTYIVVSYFAAEFGGLADYSKEEIINICFSELYTRVQSVIRSIASAGVSGRVLESEELAELLYVAYNRDESEVYQLNRAIDAQYDALYTTAKDAVKKKAEKIEQEIELDAIELTTDSIVKAESKRQENKEKINRKKAVEQKALEVLEEYRDELEDDLYELTKEEIAKKSSEEEKAVKKKIKKANSSI